MRKDLIESKLRPMALEILKTIGVHTYSSRDFWNKEWDKETLEWEYFQNGNDVRFYPPNERDWNYITFTNIRPDKIEKVEVENPVLHDNEILDADVDSITNDNSTPLNWGFEYTKTTEDIEKEDVGVALNLAVQQEIWYGVGEGTAGGGVGGKTTIKAQIEAHYNKAWERKTGVSKTHQLNLEIPPNTRMNIVQNKGRAKYTQKTITTATLGFGVEIQSRAQWYVKFDEFDDLIQAAYGYYPPKDTLGLETNNVIRHWKQHPIAEAPNLKKVLEEMGKAQIEKTIEFDRASTGDVKVKSVEL